jgi:DNA-binding transcriptional regulator LsrR (DeoR family)
LATLSERGAAISRTIVLPLSLGFSEAEVASALGISRRLVLSLLAELRDQLSG